MFVLKGAKEADLEHAGKINIGLNLKNNKKNEEVCGYTCKGRDNNWLYSTKALDILRSYMSEWPEVFDYMSSSDKVSGDFFHYADIFSVDDGEDKLKALADWIKELPCSNAARQPCGTLTVDDNVIVAIEAVVNDNIENNQRKKKIVMQLKPHLIFKPNLYKGGSLPDPEADFFLFDRVVNIREGFSVPLGLRGTIIGLTKSSTLESLSVEVLFDREFHGGLNIRSSSARGYKVPVSALINLSHGERKEKRSAQFEDAPENNSTMPYRPQQNQQFGNPKGQQLSYSKAAGSQVGQRSVKEDSPSTINAKQVTPPDPKCLPLPTELLSPPKGRGASQNNAGGIAAKGRGRGRGYSNAQNVPQQQNQQAFNMQQIWDALQQNMPMAPAAPLPGSDLTPNVQQFLAASQQLAQPAQVPVFLPLQTPVIMPQPFPNFVRPPPQAAVPGYAIPHPMMAPPQPAFPSPPKHFPQGPPQVIGRGRGRGGNVATTSSTTSFVPLQVAIKRSNRGQPQPSLKPAEQAAADGEYKAAHRPDTKPFKKATNYDQEPKSPKLQKSSSKARLAANFSTSN